MSEKPRRERLGKHSWVTMGEDITDQDELDRLSALRPPDDGGAARVLGEALSILDEREGRGKPASAVPMILGLLELLTPEQQLDLARQLPPMLSGEARTLMAEGCRDGAAAVNGAK